MVPEGESGAYKPLVQEVVKEVEEASSPLSTSPSAKMIKIEELSEVPSQASEKWVSAFLSIALNFSALVVILLYQFLSY